MKNVLILGGMVLVLVGIGVYANFFAPQMYEADSAPKIVEKEVTVDNIDKRIEQAQAAAKPEAEQKAQAEYDAILAAEMSKVKAAVLKEVELELEAQRLEIEKEVQNY